MTTDKPDTGTKQGCCSAGGCGCGSQEQAAGGCCGPVAAGASIASRLKSIGLMLLVGTALVVGVAALRSRPAPAPNGPDPVVEVIAPFFKSMQGENVAFMLLHDTPDPDPEQVETLRKVSEAVNEDGAASGVIVLGPGFAGFQSFIETLGITILPAVAVSREGQRPVIITGTITSEAAIKAFRSIEELR